METSNPFCPPNAIDFPMAPWMMPWPAWARYCTPMRTAKFRLENVANILLKKSPNEASTPITRAFAAPRTPPVAIANPTDAQACAGSKGPRQTAATTIPDRMTNAIDTPGMSEALERNPSMSKNRAASSPGTTRMRMSPISTRSRCSGSSSTPPCRSKASCSASPAATPARRTTSGGVVVVPSADTRPTSQPSGTIASPAGDGSSVRHPEGKTACAFSPLLNSRIANTSGG